MRRWAEDQDRAEIPVSFSIRTAASMEGVRSPEIHIETRGRETPTASAKAWRDPWWCSATYRTRAPLAVIRNRA